MVATIQREGIAFFARRIRERQQWQEQILSLPQALPQEKDPPACKVDALREARGVNPLQDKKSLRNESTEEARRIWAFVDKAAASAETPPGTKRN